MKHLILLLLLLVFPWMVWGDEPPSEEIAASQDSTGQDSAAQFKSFVDSVDVNVVNVDVFVTDKKGQQVLDLERDDFELLVDGREIPISNFYAINNGAVRYGAPGVETIEVPAPAREDLREPTALPEEQRLHLVVYVDNVNIHSIQRNRLLRYVRTFLRERLKPEDRVMVVSYDRYLQVHQGFSTDRELLQETLRELEELSTAGKEAENERRDLLNDIYDGKREWEVRGQAYQYAETSYRTVLETIDTLKEFVDSLAGLPGRKAVMYVSNGFSIRPGEDVFQAMEDQYENQSIVADGQRYEVTGPLRELTLKANANRVTFYTVEAAGLQGYSFINAENATSRGGSRIDEVHFANLKDPLFFIADDTGGMSILNTNNFETMLNRLAGDFDAYYSLGFSPAGVLGRYQKIRVRVKDRKGLIVRTRDGFRSKPASTQMGDATLAALFYGYERNPLGVEIEVGRSRLAEKDIFNVPITVHIPMAKLSFLPQAEKHSAKVRLFIAVKHEQGGVSSVQELPVPIDISAANFALAQEHAYQFKHSLRMQSGRQIVAIGVRDELGAISAVVTRGMNIGG